MFVQIITMKAPLGKIAQLRDLVSMEYLPAIEERPGFINAHLLEQVDDRDATKLVIYWESQGSFESLARTGVLDGSTHSIAARLPGLQVQRDSYIVIISTDEINA